MAGVVYEFAGEWNAQRLLRDDVLESLYGSRASASPKTLIERALQVMRAVAAEHGLAHLGALPSPFLGLHAGEVRITDAVSAADVVRQAVLMHASLSQLDGLDDEEESTPPAAEEVNKRFATEVREAIQLVRPELARWFGKSAALVDSGRPVKFGFFSDQAVLHFSVLHGIRQAPSVRDARAKLWELSRAKALASIPTAALITWVPSRDDPTLGERQRNALVSNLAEIEREADVVSMRMYPVESVGQARDRVLSLVD
jgi:hypothetical protein